MVFMVLEVNLVKVICCLVISSFVIGYEYIVVLVYWKCGIDVDGFKVEK